MSGVEYQMRLDKRRNEVVAMVVAFVHAHLDRVVGGTAGLLNSVCFELLLEEVIRCSLVNQYGPMLGRLTQQYAGVVGCPG